MVPRYLIAAVRFWHREFTRDNRAAAASGVAFLLAFFQLKK
jgi:hypothetical protein